LHVVVIDVKYDVEWLVTKLSILGMSIGASQKDFMVYVMDSWT